MLVRNDVEQFIQSYITGYLNSERLKEFITDRDLKLAEKNKEILELQHQMKQLLDARENVGNFVVPLFHKYRSGSVSRTELIEQLSNTLSAYGWNVK